MMKEFFDDKFHKIYENFDGNFSVSLQEHHSDSGYDTFLFFDRNLHSKYFLSIKKSIDLKFFTRKLKKIIFDEKFPVEDFLKKLKVSLILSEMEIKYGRYHNIFSLIIKNFSRKMNCVHFDEARIRSILSRNLLSFHESPLQVINKLISLFCGNYSFLLKLSEDYAGTFQYMEWDPDHKERAYQAYALRYYPSRILKLMNTPDYYKEFISKDLGLCMNEDMLAHASPLFIKDLGDDLFPPDCSDHLILMSDNRRIPVWKVLPLLSKYASDKRLRESVPFVKFVACLYKTHLEALMKLVKEFARNHNECGKELFDLIRFRNLKEILDVVNDSLSIYQNRSSFQFFFTPHKKRKWELKYFSGPFYEFLKESISPIDFYFKAFENNIGSEFIKALFRLTSYLKPSHLSRITADNNMSSPFIKKIYNILGEV